MADNFNLGEEIEEIERGINDIKKTIAALVFPAGLKEELDGIKADIAGVKTDVATLAGATETNQTNIVSALGTISNDLIQQQKQLDKILEIIQPPVADGIAIQFGKQSKTGKIKKEK